MASSRLLYSFPLVLAATLSACSAAKKNECGTLVNVINAGLEQLENGQQQRKNDPTGSVELRAMATVMDQAAQSAAQLSLSTPELKTLANRYEAMTKEIARTARELADAADKKDLDRLSKAQNALNDALKLEDPLVDELNKFCSQ